MNIIQNSKVSFQNAGCDIINSNSIDYEKTTFNLFTKLDIMINWTITFFMLFNNLSKYFTNPFTLISSCSNFSNGFLSFLNRKLTFRLKERLYQRRYRDILKLESNIYGFKTKKS